MKPATLYIVFWGLLAVGYAQESNEKEMILVWSDEFELDGKPDSTNWNYEKGFVRNHEDQWYQPHNAFCEGGKLVIEARKELKPNPAYDSESKDWRKSRESIQYTSSSLLTRGLHAWRYGRFEMRAQIDVRDGMWPAFWTLGTEGWWPVCGEIDIMEYYRGKILANAAWAGEGKTVSWDSETMGIEKFGVSNWSESYHVWRMDWDEQEIRLYVDDLLLNTISLDSTHNKRSEIRNPMMQPHYIIINLAIGGDNGGDPSNTKFPARYLIDYVRVYQYEGDE